MRQVHPLDATPHETRPKRRDAHPVGRPGPALSRRHGDSRAAPRGTGRARPVGRVRDARGAAVQTGKQGVQGAASRGIQAGVWSISSLRHTRPARPRLPQRGRTGSYCSAAAARFLRLLQRCRVGPLPARRARPIPPCGQTAMWSNCHVVKLPCGQTAIWSNWGRAAQGGMAARRAQARPLLLRTAAPS